MSFLVGTPYRHRHRAQAIRHCLGLPYWCRMVAEQLYVRRRARVHENRSYIDCCSIPERSPNGHAEVAQRGGNWCHSRNYCRGIVADELFGVFTLSPDS